MPVEYYPIFVLLILSVGLVAIIMVLPGLIAPHRAVPGKFVPYESGIRPIGPARRRFHVRFAHRSRCCSSSSTSKSSSSIPGP